MKTNTPLHIERHFLPSSSHQTEAITTLLALPKSRSAAAAEQLFAALLDPHCGSHTTLLPLSHQMFRSEAIAALEKRKSLILGSSGTSIRRVEMEQS